MSDKKFVPGSSKIKEIKSKKPVKNFLRLAVGQGFGFGFGDEIEASFRSAFSEKSYEEIVKQVRDEIDEYRAENPAAAISQEIAGSLIPTIALSVFGGPAGISAASTRYGQIINTLSKAPINISWYSNTNNGCNPPYRTSCNTRRQRAYTTRSKFNTRTSNGS